MPITSSQLGDTEFWGISQEAHLGISEAVALKSLKAYRDSRYELRVDGDGTGLRGAEPRQAETSKQFSQE